MTLHPEWQRALAASVCDPIRLADQLALTEDRAGMVAAARSFPLRLPAGLLARIRPGEGDDPLLRQFLPSGAELIAVPGFVADPLRETEISPMPGVLRRHRDRVLLLLGTACAVHCRFCFRRHFTVEVDFGLSRLGGDGGTAPVMTTTEEVDFGLSRLGGDGGTAPVMTTTEEVDFGLSRLGGDGGTAPVMTTTEEVDFGLSRLGGDGGTAPVMTTTQVERPNQPGDWEPVLDEIRRDPAIREVILSGGDPLMRSDDWLADLAQRLAAIPHLRRLRLHSRMPVLLPERVTAALVEWLTASRLQPILVVHVNHPAEIDAAAVAALARLAGAGVMLLNQSVLLKGVNDRLEILVELSERLIAAKVMPYYLHLLDPVAGAAHFMVDEEQAKVLMRQLHDRLPGYALPRLVRDLLGELGKRAVCW